MPTDNWDNQNIDSAIIKIEILSFFLANPHTRDTINGFSRRLFIHQQLISAVMEELIELGIVEKSGSNDKAIYRLKISYDSLEKHLA